jgi:response regulator of citrate/malate metabolism
VINTLIVDDDYRVADIHASYVDRVDGFHTVGRAHSVTQAEKAAVALHPHLILLDLYLPDGHGLALLRRLGDLMRPRPDAIVISAAEDIDDVRAAIQLGAIHYLVKPFGFDRFAQQLTAYHDLHARLSTLGRARQRDVDALYGLLRRPVRTATTPPDSPTLAMVRDAVRNAGQEVTAGEIAESVGISRSTAQRYLARLAEQGDVASRRRYGGTGRPENLYRVRR